jgi:hypothetical protein
MPIIRGHHSFDEFFTQIPNDWVRDARLSLKARGLLTLVMSHSRGWSLSINLLAQQNQEGKDAIRSAINELEEFGYLTRSQVNEGGRFGEAVWTTHDPADLPMAENPTTDNPTPKKNIIKEEQVKELKAHPEDLFNEFWTAYPRKLDKAKAFRAFRSALKRATFEDILAGVLLYRNDPKRDPEFTKYPATWLNNDAWENSHEPSKDSEAFRRAQERREKERALSDAFLAEQKEREKLAAPAPKCPHGNNVALCKECLR